MIAAENAAASFSGNAGYGGFVSAFRRALPRQTLSLRSGHHRGHPGTMPVATTGVTAAEC